MTIESSNWSSPATVNLYLQSEMDADNIVDLGIPHVFIATGAHWRRDGAGRSSRTAMDFDTGTSVMTPDDIMAGLIPEPGPVIIYDDEQSYMGGVIAEQLAATHPNIRYIHRLALLLHGPATLWNNTGFTRR